MLTKLLSFGAIGFLLVLSGTTFTLAFSYDETVEESQFETRCGEVFKNVTAVINYKLFEPVIANERCVWIIAPANTGAYDVQVNFGFDPALKLVTVAGINLLNTTKEIIHPEASGTTYRVESNILVVTFHSSDSLSGVSGFNLIATRVVTATIHASSRYEIIELPAADNRFVIHPDRPGKVNTTNELSTLVFVPPQNVYTGSSITYTYTKLELLGTDCADSLSIDVFNATSANFWEFGERLCDQGEARITSDDIVLMTLRTGTTANVYRLFYVGTSNPQCSGSVISK